MKHLSSTLATVGVILALCGPAATANDEDAPNNKKKNVPPGLQKKPGGLPPGQAKKQGYGQSAPSAPNAPSNNSTPTPVQAKEVTPTPTATPEASKPVAEAPKPATSNPSSTPTATTPDPTAPKVSREVQARRAKVESLVAEIDSYGNTPEARERIFTRLHRNSNIPLSTLEAQRKAFPDAGLGGLTVANYISKGNPKVSAHQVLAERKSTGAGWGEIAQGRGVHLTDLIDWLNEANASAKQAGTAGRIKGL